MATEDDKPNSGLIGTVTIAGAIAMVAICAVLTALVRSEQDSEDERKNADANLKPLTELRAEQEKTLKAAPSYADEKKERITLPLDRAMAAVVKDIQDNPQAATAPGSEPPPAADADAGAGDAGAEATDGGAPAEGDAAAPTEGQKLDGKDEKPKEKKKPAPQKTQGPSGTQPPPDEGAE
ncbi:MAG: hypothetical protein H6718_23765 [Polyangiaceae bacterium]|nr:hypothetical protein [Myxococcales bacterium]MCB9588446.1 hypothetical protein [Polyangiaceae bacterium]